MNNHSDELTHYGIPGMKWGHHKSAAYKSAKTNYKKAKKQYFKTRVTNFGSQLRNDVLRKSEYDTKSGKRVMTRQRDDNKAYINKINTKAKLKSISTKKTNKLGYNKAEFNAYVKGLNKSGIPNSLADRIESGRGTDLYKSITRKKGKAYADAVLSKTSNQKLNAVVGGALVAVGLQVTKHYIKNKK